MLRLINASLRRTLHSSTLPDVWAFEYIFLVWMSCLLFFPFSIFFFLGGTGTAILWSVLGVLTSCHPISITYNTVINGIEKKIKIKQSLNYIPNILSLQSFDLQLSQLDAREKTIIEI